MRWAPGGDKLALALGGDDTRKVGPRLVLLDPETCAIEPLIEDFPAEEQQWDFLSSMSIIYADGGDLVTCSAVQWESGSLAGLSLWSEPTTLFSLASLHDEN